MLGWRHSRIDCQRGPGSGSMTRGFVGRCVPRAKLRTRWTWLTSRPTDGRLTAFLIDDRYRTLRRHAYPILDLHLHSPRHPTSQPFARPSGERPADSFPESHLNPPLFFPSFFFLFFLFSLHQACFRSRLNAPSRQPNRRPHGPDNLVAWSILVSEFTCRTWFAWQASNGIFREIHPKYPLIRATDGSSDFSCQKLHRVGAIFVGLLRTH